LFRDRGIGAVTWGLPHTPQQDANDAQVARRLARTLGVPHRFFPIETPDEGLESVFERFLCVGEGRVARISGYVDGFRIWQTLFDEGCQGVIRGDEAFGSVPVGSADAARWTASLTTLADYFSAAELASFELPAQTLPPALERRHNETPATWRDRLYQQFRVPTLLAGLTDLKTAYIEVGNPLLANSVLTCVRTLPDHLRTEKRLWHELVGRQLPSLALARRVAIPALTDFLGDPRVLELLLDDLSSESAGSVFSPLLRARCLSALRGALRQAKPAQAAERRAPGIARAVPAKLRAVMRHWSRPTLDPVVLAFRASLATRMQRLLGCDAATPPARIQPAVNA